MPSEDTATGGISTAWNWLTGPRSSSKRFPTPALELFRAEALGLTGWGGRSPPVLQRGGRRTLEWWIERPPTPRQRTVRPPARRDALAGAESFGATWDGYIGPLPMDNTPRSTWPEFYAEQRILPYLRRAADRGALTPGDVRLVEKVLDALDHLAGDPEPPARIHGDLWNGNVLWQDDGAVVIDPAAHGGHREADLAMLALFGLPYLDRVRDAYNEVAPLAEGWPDPLPVASAAGARVLFGRPTAPHCGDGPAAPAPDQRAVDPGNET